MAKRVYDNGMTYCTCVKDYDEQQKCEDFLQHSKDKRCSFINYGQFCDWHPHMTNVVNSKVYRAAIPKKTKTSWPSADELAERRQAIIEGTDCGI